MPTHDFVDIGDVLNYEFLQGTIKSIDASTDTCVVTVGASDYPALIFWHPDPECVLRDNGAIQGSAQSFCEGDEVIIMRKKNAQTLYDAKVLTGGQPRFRVMIKWKQIAIDPSFISLCDQMIARIQQEKVYATQFREFVYSDIVPWLESWIGKKIRGGSSGGAAFTDPLMY